ncbi:MAG: hypothetical protein JWL74_41 [Alphaproteobacteria bacterium]|nr:hypothetical protein [Alphaproteobacteria bacterium]
MPHNQKIRIGLLWHSVRSGNLGVGALTVSNIALLREACAELGLQPQFVVMGGHEQGEAYVVGDDIEALDVDRRFISSRAGYRRALKSLDCLVDIGGGDSFAEIYDWKRFAYIWLTKYLALRRRRPLLLSPQTIGPFDHQPWRGLAAYVMKRSDAVLARDPVSYDLARALAGSGRTLLSVDVAFALPFQRRAREPGPVEIGVNVSGLLFHGGGAGDNRFGLDVDYAALTRELLARLTARDDVKVKLITHVVTTYLPLEDDARVADRLAAEFPRAERVPDFASPSDAKSYISGLDFLIAGRMHACIAALSSGVPMVPIAYSRKFDGLFKGVLDYQHGVPVKGSTTSEALDYLLSAIERRGELREDVARALGRVEKGLDVYRAELRRFLEHSRPAV